MDFRPAKSRSLVVRRGKVTHQFRFWIGGVRIPSVEEKPVKSLGKIYNCTLKDTAALQSTVGVGRSLKSIVSLCQKAGPLEHFLSCCPRGGGGPGATPSRSGAEGLLAGVSYSRCWGVRGLQNREAIRDRHQGGCGSSGGTRGEQLETQARA